MFLVNSQRLWATIKCFAASGNRFPPAPIPTKRAAAMPQPSLGRSVVDMCRPGLPRAGCRPAKTVGQVLGARHEIVKSQNGGGKKMFLFFPARFAFRKGIPASARVPLLLFPEVSGDSGTNSTPAHCVGGWCRRCPCIARLSVETRSARPDRLHPEAAGSVPSRQCAGRRCPRGRQCPISSSRFPPRS